MSATSIAEFQSYRFVRDRNGSLAEIPLERRGERQFLVLDCLRYRLARLHIFEGLAGNGETEMAARFQAEIDSVRQLGHPLVTPILSFGRDDTELFIADSFVNGEALGRYLRRTGPLSETHSLEVILDLLDLLTSQSALPRTLANFDTGRLHVSADPARPGRLRLHFNDFTGWTTPAMPTPAELAARLALALYSLLAGFVFRFPPFSPFEREAVQTSAELRSMLVPMLADDAATRNGFPDLKSLRAALAAHLERRRQSGTDREAEPAEPREFLRDWMLDGGGPVDPGPAYRMLGPDPAGAGYVFDAASVKGSAQGRARFQLFPGWESIPRDGWLEQHQAALRRPGRGLPNQLTVSAVEPWGRCLLIGEERVEGLTLESVIRELGPLELAHCREIASKVNAALDAIEKTAGAAAVWWLPARNVHLVTGDENAGLLRQAVRHHGTAAWQRLPVRLRLHQTARDLVAGLTFPESILKRIRAGGKAGERGRRATVLLPLLSEMLSGEPFAWDRPIEAHDRLPVPAARLLEQTRVRLLEDPKIIQSWLLDDLARLLDVENDKGKSRETVTTAMVDGLVSAPASLFDGLNAEDGDLPRPKAAPAGKLASAFNRLAGDLKPFGRKAVAPEIDTVTVAPESGPTTVETADANSPEVGDMIVDESVSESEAPVLTVDSKPEAAKSGGWFGVFRRRRSENGAKAPPPSPEPSPELVETEAVESSNESDVFVSPPKPELVESVAETQTQAESASTSRRIFPFGRKHAVAAPVVAELDREPVSISQPEPEPTLLPVSPSETGPIATEVRSSARRPFSFRSTPRDTVALVATEVSPTPIPEPVIEETPIPTSIIAFPSPAAVEAVPSPPEPEVPSPTASSFAEAVAALVAAPNPFATPAPVPDPPAQVTEFGQLPAPAASDNPFERPMAEVLAENSPIADEEIAPAPIDSGPEAETEPAPINADPEPEAEVALPPVPEETVPVQPAVEAPSTPADPEPSLAPIIYDGSRATTTEPMSFFAFLKTESQTVVADPVATAPVAEASQTTEPKMPSPVVADSVELPSIGRLFSSSGSSAETVGANLEETAAAARIERSRTRRQVIVRTSRAVAIFVVAALVLWGLTYGLVAIAGSVERETLAETLAPVIHTDYLKLAQKAPFSDANQPQKAALPESTGAVAEIGKASEAIHLGDDARQQGRFADAVNLYLRAIELEPQSEEARTLLWSTMESWTSAQSEPSSPGGGRIERSADHAPKAAWLLADYYLDRDRALGLRWLRKSAESGHPRHQRLLGIVLSPVPENLPEAADWFRRAAESGDAEGQLLYGACLLRGRGVPIDAKAGADWIEKAANSGEPRALDLAGVCCATGLGRETDQAAAVGWFQRACDAGNARARYNLAIRYAKGLGVKTDKTRAAREFQAGADAGDADSMHGLGRCLEAGFGVIRDHQAAADWMRRAAALGHHEALAWCLRQGISVDVDTPATEVVAKS
jgi:TPR repeat protein